VHLIILLQTVLLLDFRYDLPSRWGFLYPPFLMWMILLDPASGSSRAGFFAMIFSFLRDSPSWQFDCSDLPSFFSVSSSSASGASP